MMWTYIVNMILITGGVWVMNFQITYILGVGVAEYYGI